MLLNLFNGVIDYSRAELSREHYPLICWFSPILKDICHDVPALNLLNSSEIRIL